MPKRCFNVIVSQRSIPPSWLGWALQPFPGLWRSSEWIHECQNARCCEGPLLKMTGGPECSLGVYSNARGWNSPDVSYMLFFPFSFTDQRRRQWEKKKSCKNIKQGILFVLKSAKQAVRSDLLSEFSAQSDWMGSKQSSPLLSWMIKHWWRRGEDVVTRTRPGQGRAICFPTWWNTNRNVSNVKETASREKRGFVPQLKHAAAASTRCQAARLH